MKLFILFTSTLNATRCTMNAISAFVYVAFSQINSVQYLALYVVYVAESASLALGCTKLLLTS